MTDNTNNMTIKYGPPMPMEAPEAPAPPVPLPHEQAMEEAVFTEENYVVLSKCPNCGTANKLHHIDFKDVRGAVLISIEESYRCPGAKDGVRCSKVAIIGMLPSEPNAVLKHRGRDAFYKRLNQWISERTFRIMKMLLP